jgi:hypothetical protein
VEYKYSFDEVILKVSLDSSVGRAEDCRGIIAEILRSLVRLRFEGDFFLNQFFTGGFVSQISPTT